MCSNNCFPKSIADVFPLWYCVNTHLKVADLQTKKTFIEALTPADIQLIKCIWLAAPGCFLPLTPIEVRVYLVFHTLLYENNSNIM